MNLFLCRHFGILFLLPIFINAISLSEFICQSAKICNRSPTIQEFCDIFDICLNGIHKTPPTPLEVLNLKLNMTEICNNGLSIKDLQIIQRDYFPTLIITNPTTSPTNVALLTTQFTPVFTPEIQPMSPELISVIVISSLMGLGLIIGLFIVIRKKFIK